jgi:hypothetical protein
VIKFGSDFRYVGGFRYFAGLLIDGFWKENIETCISHDISLSKVITCGVCPTPGTQSLFYFSLTLTVLTWLWSFGKTMSLFSMAPYSQDMSQTEHLIDEVYNKKGMKQRRSAQDDPSTGVE